MSHRIEPGQEYAVCTAWPDNIRIRVVGGPYPGAFGDAKARVVTLSDDGRELRPRLIGAHLLHPDSMTPGGRRRRTGFYLVKSADGTTPTPTAPALTVHVGQIWEDNDKRATGRRVRIVALDTTHATVERHQPRRAARSPKPGRISRIRLDRFLPTSTGYRLVQHPDGTPAGEAR